MRYEFCFVRFFKTGWGCGGMAGPLYIRMSQVSLADLQNENDAERSFRKFKLVCEEVQVKGMDSSLDGFLLNDDNFVHLVMHLIQLICTSG